MPTVTDEKRWMAPEAFRAGLATGGRKLGKPVQVVGQAAPWTSQPSVAPRSGSKQVVRVHKVRAYVVHVELGYGRRI